MGRISASAVDCHRTGGWIIIRIRQQGQPEIAFAAQVDATRQMSATAPGSTVFQGGGQDVFASLNDLITLLQTPGMPTAADLGTAKTNIDLALDNVLTVRASAGSRLQELDALDYAGEDRHIQYSQILSDLQDIDYTQALTQLSQQQFTLEAAQRSFVTVSGLSLFNFL